MMTPDLADNTQIELPSAKDIERYKQRREIAMTFNHKLVEQLPKSAINECAKKLGLLQRNTLVFSCEDEVSVLMDYCLFHFRINKVNVISRYLLMSPPAKDSIEMELLETMQKAYYSLLIVKKVFQNKGVLVFDFVNEKDIFLIDLGLSISAKGGMMFASHIIPIGQFYRTSGAMLPIPASLFEDEIAAIVEKFFTKNDILSPAQEALFAAQVIRAALKAEVMENVRYQ
jgi:hypothetical protein